MKSTQIKRKDHETPVTELKLQPIGGDEKLGGNQESYDGGFHIQSSAVSKKRVVSKRSALQEFSFR